MFKNRYLITPIAIGKLTGFLIGLIGFIILPFIADTTLMLRIGILLWYTTFGAIIGIFGSFTKCPISGFPIAWWLRSSLIGAWMNFVLTLFVYDQFKQIIISVIGKSSILASPFWFVLEGAIIGLIIGYFTTCCNKECIDTKSQSEHCLKNKRINDKS